MKLIKNGLFLAGITGIGYAGYKMSKKVKEYKEYYEHPIVFSGKEDVITGEYEGGTYGILCGGLSIDLTKAELVNDEASLYIEGEFCGISITVPENWNVKVDGNSEKSGISIKSKYNENDTESKKLFIKYDVKFAGFEVKCAKASDELEEDFDLDGIDMDDFQYDMGAE